MFCWTASMSAEGLFFNAVSENIATFYKHDKLELGALGVKEPNKALSTFDAPTVLVDVNCECSCIFF